MDHVEDYVKNWFTYPVKKFKPEWHEAYKDNTENYTRVIIGSTSAIVLLIAVVGCIKVKIWTAPRFIQIQAICIVVCNFFGICFSLSQLGRRVSIYENWFNFAW